MAKCGEDVKLMSRSYNKIMGVSLQAVRHTLRGILCPHLFWVDNLLVDDDDNNDDNDDDDSCLRPGGVA
jgi:hypothetical protein